MPRRTVSIEDVECVKETAQAICCVIDGEEKWIPKSVIGDDSEVFEEGDEGTLVIHEWFAEKENIG